MYICMVDHHIITICMHSHRLLLGYIHTYMYIHIHIWFIGTTHKQHNQKGMFK